MVNKHKSRTGFTLVELLVVIIIIALLSALTLGALRTGGIRAKEDSTRSFVVQISDSLMELFEELDDQGYTLAQQQSQIPDTKSQALSSPSNLPFGSTYQSYAMRIGGADTERAECLYMIMTQTGYFSDFIESLHERQVANTGGGSSPELIDPWGTPIQLEWQTVTIGGNVVDLPVIRSAGVDQVWDEDWNGNNVLDAGEDLNGNSVLDQSDDDIVSINENGIFAQ